MLEKLESEDPKEGKYDPDLCFQPKRSVYLHSFDSTTYPPLLFDSNNRRLAKLEDRKGTEIIEVGSGRAA